MEENKQFDTVIESNDWRDSAAIVGLVRYFNYFDIPYNWDSIKHKKSDGLDTLMFNKSDISEERYLEYVERTYADEMYHVAVINILRRDEMDDEAIKNVNENLKANTIMKKVFGNIKFDGSNQNDILKIIEDNRYELIRETYRNKILLYRNYCNTNQLFAESQPVCRLNGYYVDMPKKGKSLAYNFDTASFVSSDEWYYDFIPLGFTYGHESIFINDSSSLMDLLGTNNLLYFNIENERRNSEKGWVDSRKLLFKNIIDSAEFLELDTEVIVKKSDKNYFETMFIRKQSIKILKGIKKYESLCFSIKVGEDYINIQEKVTNAILNLELLNDLIIFLLKKDAAGTGISDNVNQYSRCIMKLININVMIKNEIYKEREEKNMKIGIYNARDTAKKVVKKLTFEGKDNKLRSYRMKLTSSMVFKDYARFCEILLNLSDYSNVSMDFAYDLFENFERNQELAFAFVNALTVTETEDNNDDNKDKNKDDNKNGKGEKKHE